MSKTIDKEKLPVPLRPYAGMIEEVSDERSSGNGYWVYLVAGLRYYDGTHCVHEDTPRACAFAMANVEPCSLECCEAAPSYGETGDVELDGARI